MLNPAVSSLESSRYASFATPFETTKGASGSFRQNSHSTGTIHSRPLLCFDSTAYHLSSMLNFSYISSNSPNLTLCAVPSRLTRTAELKSGKSLLNAL